MDRTTLNTRLERIQNEISKLVNTLYALNLTDSDTYPQNYEELSTDAALRAEKIACTLRNLIYSANLEIQTTEYDAAVAALEKAVQDFGGFVERRDLPRAFRCGREDE